MNAATPTITLDASRSVRLLEYRRSYGTSTYARDTPTVSPDHFVTRPSIPSTLPTESTQVVLSARTTVPSTRRVPGPTLSATATRPWSLSSRETDVPGAGSTVVSG